MQPRKETPRHRRRAVRSINRAFERAAKEQQGPRIEWDFKERPYDPEEDEGFIYKNWIGGLREVKPWRAMSYHHFATQQRKVIGDLLRRTRVVTTLAVQEEIGEPKFGWICYEWRGPIFVLHFIYVRGYYRNKRIGTRLLESAGVKLGETPIVCSAWTKAIAYLVDRWNLDFNFFVAWRDTDVDHRNLDQGPSFGRDLEGHEQPQPGDDRGDPRTEG